VAKRTKKRVSDAKRLRSEGRSNREIAEILSKGGVTVTEGTIRNWLGPVSTPPEDLEEVVPPPPATSPEPLDESTAAPEEIVGALAGLLRQAKAEALRLKAAGDHTGARQESRLAGYFANLIQKERRRDEDEGDMVRVRPTDITAAAERARSKLRELVARLVEEQAK
jgi:hypothetical protein